MANMHGICRLLLLLLLLISSLGYKSGRTRKPWNAPLGRGGAVRRHILFDFYDNKQINELAHAHDATLRMLQEVGELGGGVKVAGRQGGQLGQAPSMTHPVRRA